jgi:hypothetical protein
MTRQVIFITSIVLWLVSILFLLPCTGVSCFLVLVLMSIPKLPFRIPGGDLIVILSWPMSVVLAIVASVCVVLAASNHHRALKYILLVDLLALAITIPLLYYGPNLFVR